MLERIYGTYSLYLECCHQAVVVSISLLFNQDLCLDLLRSFGYWKFQKKKNLDTLKNHLDRYQIIKLS
jgi:hypothetical protein